jgi:hypothetical protein
MYRVTHQFTTPLQVRHGGDAAALTHCALHGFSTILCTRRPSTLPLPPLFFFPFVCSEQKAVSISSSACLSARITGCWLVTRVCLVAPSSFCPDLCGWAEAPPPPAVVVRGDGAGCQPWRCRFISSWRGEDRAQFPDRSRVLLGIMLKLLAPVAESSRHARRV